MNIRYPIYEGVYRILTLIISMLIVNHIGNNRNHREGTCESLRCTVFLLV